MGAVKKKLDRKEEIVKKEEFYPPLAPADYTRSPVSDLPAFPGWFPGATQPGVSATLEIERFEEAGPEIIMEKPTREFVEFVSEYPLESYETPVETRTPLPIRTSALLETVAAKPERYPGTGNVIPTIGTQRGKGDGVFSVNIGPEEEPDSIRTTIQYTPGPSDKEKYDRIFSSQIVSTTDPYSSRGWRLDGGSREWSQDGFVWVKKLIGRKYGVKSEHPKLASLEDRPGGGWADDYNQYFETYAIGVRPDKSFEILGGVRWSNEMRDGKPTFVSKASRQQVRPGDVSKKFLELFSAPMYEGRGGVEGFA